MQREQLALDDLGDHLGEANLLDLELRDDLVEHHPLLGVRERFFVARHRRAQRSPGNSVAGLGEAHERALEPARAGKNRVGGQMHVAEDQLARVAGAQRELPLQVLRCESLRIRRHDEAADRLPFGIVIRRLRPHDAHLGRGPVRDPHLAAVQDPGTVLLLTGPCEHPGRIRAVVGLREPEASDDLALRHLRQPFHPLLFAAELVDRIHHQRALHARERADAAVAAFELLHDEPVAHVVEPGAPVLLGQVRAEHAELRHRRDEFLREAAGDVALADDRQHLLVDEPADGIAHGALVFGECGVDVEQVAVARLQLRRGEKGLGVMRGHAEKIATTRGGFYGRASTRIFTMVRWLVMVRLASTSGSPSRDTRIATVWPAMNDRLHDWKTPSVPVL